MNFQVHLQPSGQHFPCEAEETILEAALRAGVGLPYSCRNGSCGACAATIAGGTVAYPGAAPRALTPEQAARGVCLPCCAIACTDVQLEASEVAGNADFPVRKMPCRVSAMQKLAPDVMQLTLQLAAGLQYRAGQYVDFMLRDGTRRSYSVANAPDQTGALTLHIRHISGGRFSEQVFRAMQERDILRLEGPHGSFFLHEDSDKPMLLLATGTGFAPLKAMVEQLIALELPRPMVLYWGGRRPHDLYMDGLCREWAARLPHFRYVPVLSAPLAEDGWQGRVGHADRAAIADFPDLSAHQVYACGAPAMVESARRDCVRLCQLPEDEFFADIFVSPQEKKQATPQSGLRP